MTLRKFTGWILYVGYLCAFVLGLSWVVHSIQVRSLREKGQPEFWAEGVPLPVDVWRKLGWFRNSKTNTFAHFELEKAAGTIRIGCFGDSFTAGSEVADGWDYPALLQRRFDEAGYNNVEVINFGSDWYGASQTYVMWDTVGRSYDLDYLLLGPMTFLERRDLTFHHTLDLHPFGLHARHILTGDNELELVSVIGDDFGDRFEAYRRFFPHHRYLRYDRHPPGFLRALVPEGRSVSNVFYYSNQDRRAEASAIYMRLLSRYADSGLPVLLSQHLPDVLNSALLVDRSNLYELHIRRNRAFPFYAPRLHNSPTGNRWVADHFFRALTGSETPIALVELVDVAQLEVPAEVQLPIAQHERAWIAIGEQEIGFFGVTQQDSSDYFADQPGKSMVAFQPVGRPLVDSLFLVLPYELTEDMLRDATLPVELVSRRLGLWRVEVNYSRREFAKPNYLVISPSDVKRFEEFELQGERLFRLAPTGLKDTCGVHCVGRSWVVLSSSDSVALHPDVSQQTRVLDLVLEESGVHHRIPIAFWQRAESPAPRIGLDRPIIGPTPF